MEFPISRRSEKILCIDERDRAGRPRLFKPAQSFHLSLHYKIEPPASLCRFLSRSVVRLVCWLLLLLIGSNFEGGKEVISDGC